jgi:hypothetical protein
MLIVAGLQNKIAKVTYNYNLQFKYNLVVFRLTTANKTSTEKANGIWLRDHFSAQYRTKLLDPITHSAANA